MKKILRFLSVLLFVVVVLVIAYFLGPKPASPVLDPIMPVISANLTGLDSSIKASETAMSVRPDNEARIVWADSSKKEKTAISLIYLHGFGASQEEGMPMHREFAKRYGLNLYLSRIAGHGLTEAEPMEHLTADLVFNSAKKAMAIGQRLGDSVILMATSAGGVYALELAAIEKNIPIKALILYSPCVRIFDPKAWILSGPWGLQIARKVRGSNYIVSTRKDSVYTRYWYPQYRIEGAICLQQLIDKSMNAETFSQIKIPVLTCMYYKDAAHQDSVVNTESIREMVQNLGTPAEKKELIVVPNAGDHVIGCYLTSRALPDVRKATFDFADRVLNMKKAAN